MTNATAATLFLTTAPDPIGAFLQIPEANRFLRFTAANGVSGLMRVNGDVLNILAIHSARKGKGHVRNFIVRAKEEFAVVRFLAVWNEDFRDALARHCFMARVIVQDHGERVNAMVWKRTAR